MVFPSPSPFSPINIALSLENCCKPSEIAINFSFDINVWKKQEDYELAKQIKEKHEATHNRLNVLTAKECTQDLIESAHQHLEIYDTYPTESTAANTLSAAVNAGLWQEYSGFADKVLALYPNSRDLLLQKISLLYYANQLEAAKKLFETFPKLETGDDLKIYGALYYIMKGNVFYELGSTREASYYWQRALDTAILENAKEDLNIRMKLVEFNGMVTPELKKQYAEFVVKKIKECPASALYKDKPIGKLGALYKILEAP